ncbi:MAG: branched-chain amino acid ABC transporter permease [Mycobacteriales bacterium]
MTRTAPVAVPGAVPVAVLAVAPVAVLAVAPVLVGGELGYGLGTTACIWVLLALGYQVTYGFSGQLSVAQGALLGVGAYTVGRLMTSAGWTFGEALPLALVATAAMGAVVGLPAVRVRGDVLALATLGAGEILQALYLRLPLTGAFQGVAGIPEASVFGHSLGTPGLYGLALVLALVAFALVAALRVSVLGRAMLADRDDPLAAAALGIRAGQVRLVAFAVGAAFAGVAGALFAVQDGYVSSVSFGLTQSVSVLLIAFLAGQGRLVRTVVVAAGLAVVQVELAGFPRVSTGVTGLAILAVLALRARERAR